MQPKRALKSWRQRRLARLQDRTRPHGRHAAYAHARLDALPHGRRAKRPTYFALAVTVMVFIFLALVVIGAFAPKPGPLVKHEPVSTERIR